MKKILILITIILLSSCVTSKRSTSNGFVEVNLNTEDYNSKNARENSSKKIPVDNNRIIEKNETAKISVNEKKDYKKIQIHLYGEPDMNPNEYGSAQKIDVCIYELNWKQSFINKAFNTAEKKNKKLLKCEVFDKSVNKTTRISVYPGKDTYFTIDRYKKLAHVAIVAEYPVYNAKTSIRLHNVPYHGISKGWTWMKSDVKEPYTATITHKFGAKGIVKIKRK